MTIRDRIWLLNHNIKQIRKAADLLLEGKKFWYSVVISKDTEPPSFHPMYWSEGDARTPVWDAAQKWAYHIMTEEEYQEALRKRDGTAVPDAEGDPHEVHQG